MMELVRITAQYSNAVLVAVLPHVSDFAAKIEVPVHVPITANQVLEFKCDPRKGQVGGQVTLTNHFEFTYLDGRVCMYRSPESYFSLQDPGRIPSFYGKVAVGETEAIRAVHKATRKLGYTDTMLHTDTAPKITRPEKVGTNYVARYRFQWLDPSWRGSKDSGVVPAVLDVEINALNQRIEMMTISSPESRRPSPKIGIESQALVPPTAPKIPQNNSVGAWASKEYALAALQVVLPEISNFITNIGLAVPVPATTNDVDMARYTCVIENNNPVIQLYLKNGDRFNYLHGHVAAYYAHDAFLKFPDRGRVQDFLGKVAVSTNEAVKLVKDSLKRLGFAETKVDITAESPTPVGTNSFTRLFVHVGFPTSDSEIAVFEIDLSRKGIKSVYYDDHSAWRQMSKIGAPPIMQTNRPSF
jgi:hypothetical protein